MRELAREKLGFSSLRPGQEEAAAAVIAGRDALVVLPTGSGKSAIYLIAGAALGGVTVVVSPLIALQRDQVAAIGEQLGGAVEINSSLGARARADAFSALAQGAARFAFVAPEQLANDETRAALASTRPNLVVVDEAHCISSWGHDFRPDYLRLGEFIAALGRPRVLALTATAAPPVRAEIIEQFDLHAPLEVVRGFVRPNIHLAVAALPGEEELRGALLDAACAQTGTGLIYVATQRAAEELAAALAERGREAAAYHAGLTTARRDAVHARFLADEPVVVVATVAFGMGIDAPHVRFVLHAEPPESLDAYYQEFGRSGRDGAAATAIVFHRTGDAGGRRFFAGASEVPVGDLERLARLVEDAGTISLGELRTRSEQAETWLTVALDLLTGAGALEVAGAGEVRWRRNGPSVATAAARAAAAQEVRRRTEQSRAEMMRRYLETDACRWRTILGYFGQPSPEDCGHCDNCDSGATEAEARAPEPYPLGAQVRHKEWGAGQVIGYGGDAMTVLFDAGGYRTLSVALVQENALVELVEEAPATPTALSH